jgi:hypothetical protein
MSSRASSGPTQSIAVTLAALLATSYGDRVEDELAGPPAQ